MSIYTFVVDFGTGPHPAISRNTDILGGTLQAVRFSDALAELESVTEQRDELLEVAIEVASNSILSGMHVGEMAQKAIENVTGAQP